MGHIELARWADLVVIAPGHGRRDCEARAGQSGRPVDHGGAGHAGTRRGGAGNEPADVG